MRSSRIRKCSPPSARHAAPPCSSPTSPTNHSPLKKSKSVNHRPPRRNDPRPSTNKKCINPYTSTTKRSTPTKPPNPSSKIKLGRISPLATTILSWRSKRKPQPRKININTRSAVNLCKTLTTHRSPNSKLQKLTLW